ncbi:Uncharacterised protein [Mycobacteroides abscessus subsp. abscessus]|nr:Uncharacterised protein [Mycobacteroides abscessus subsp. abscessus]
MRQRHRVQRLGERADLVHLDQQGIRRTPLNAFFQALRIGDKQIVAHQLHAVADRRGERDPAVPVVLRQRVLDGHQRVSVEQLGVERTHLLGGALLLLKAVTVCGAVELGGGDIQRQRHIRAQLEAGRLDGGADQVQRGPRPGDVGGKPALVAQAGGQALLLEHRLQRVVDLGAPPQGLLEARGTDRRHHELLHIHPGISMRATVEDVHHRHRQDVCVRPAQVAEQGQPGRIGSGLGHGQRDTQDGVGTQP